MASNDASQPDPRKGIIFKCIQDAFADSGLKPIKTPQDQIVWTKIPPEVRDDIADFLEKCISKQIKPPIGDLSGPLTVLVAHAPVMVVGDLVNDLIALLDSMGQGN